MPDGSDRKSLARSACAAYETNDRDRIDSLLADKMRRTEVYFGWNLE